MASLFSSKLELEEPLYYDEMFEDQGIHNEDQDLESYIYNINIFGSNYEIAIGKEKQIQQVSFYYVYLVYQMKVVSKIGLYEVKNDGETVSPNFEELELLLHPRYYQDPLYLKNFSTPISLDGEDDIEEEEERKEPEIGEAQVTTNSIVLSGNKLAIDRTGNLDELYDMIKINMKSYEDKMKSMENMKYIKGVISSELPTMIGMMIKNTPNIKKALTLLKSLVKEKVKNPKTGEMVTRFSLILKSLNYKKTEEMYSYSINEFVLILLEFVLNIKFLILNDANEMNTISLLDIDESQLQDDYLSKIEEQIKSQGASKAETKLPVINDMVKGYDPTHVVFLRKEGNVFVPLKYKGTVMHDLYELDDVFHELFINLLKAENHHYLIDKQFSNYMNKYSTLFVTEEKPVFEDFDEEDTPAPVVRKKVVSQPKPPAPPEAEQKEAVQITESKAAEVQEKPITEPVVKPAAEAQTVSASNIKINTKPKSSKISKRLKALKLQQKSKVASTEK